MTSKIKVDTIEEKTSANGVAIDSVTLKDGGVTATAASTITTADNSDTLTLVSTDAGASAAPKLILDRASASPADDDLIGRISYRMRNDAGEQIDLVKTSCFIGDASDGTEDTQFEIDQRIGGTFRNMLTMASSAIVFNEDSQDIDFRVESDGNVNMFYVNAGSNAVLIGKSATGNAKGIQLTEGTIYAVQEGSSSGAYNRLINDGSLIDFYQDTVGEGSISVSGSTVFYNSFTGSHWSRLADNSKPTILRGTIMDSIDEMCDWYQAVADVEESTDDKGNVTPAHTVKESIALGDKSVGDEITFTSDGTEYTGTIVKEDDVKHTKCKVSDTADSKKVYGVFSNWDDADDGLDGDVNDMYIAQVGTFIIRVNKDETVEAGDLLVSNGDGTAKVQDDDIIRSKTVAKVNSNIKVETYEDGSYTVPCTLHC
jgi:predicted DNA-binding protein